ncbi:hypothetical protein NDN08_000803 [Rhodosorus marinus]|uniref:Ribosomal protein L10e/L16 domain-containing protein n=1 Tax=Rhodosorus marinus TaxID=101924 RepID=A0AAV8UP08_9RHOD|nr:hypothetical protein NDN08_000803 [Rhodosorus marinus]
MAGRQLRPQPSKMKHRFQRWERDVSAERESVLRFGDYGLKVVGNHPRRKDLGFYTLEQKCLQASQATLIKLLRSSTDSDGTKRVKLWRHVFPHFPYSKKPAEVKMGKGKGNIAGYVAVCKRGQVIFEWTMLPLNTGEHILDDIFKQLQTRINLKIKLIKRPVYNPTVPQAVEEEMKRRKAIRLSENIPRNTYIPLPRRPNALEHYVSELSEEEKKMVIAQFQKDHPERDALRHWHISDIQAADWETKDEDN